MTSILFHASDFTFIAVQRGWIEKNRGWLSWLGAVNWNGLKDFPLFRPSHLVVCIINQSHIHALTICRSLRKAIINGRWGYKVMFTNEVALGKICNPCRKIKRVKGAFLIRLLIEVGNCVRVKVSGNCTDRLDISSLTCQVSPQSQPHHHIPPNRMKEYRNRLSCYQVLGYTCL
jgi:hypothetical protein